MTWPYFGLKFGFCVDGQNACPPEEVVEFPATPKFLEAIADPDDEKGAFKADPEYQREPDWVDAFVREEIESLGERIFLR